MAQLGIGSAIGKRYRLIGLLGHGGMGQVYKAEDLKLPGKFWAIKVNGPSKQEASLLMGMQHVNLPVIVDLVQDESSGRNFLIEELIVGETLQACWLRYERKMPFQLLLSIAVQLAEALRYLHQLHPPVIHRDLKPTNVMIQQDGRIKLIDFGIARVYKQGRTDDTSFLGTPGFAAPEQSGGGQSDARTDLYGLGALLYYLIYGRYYTTDQDRNREDMDRQPDIPAPFAAVLASLLRKEPELRCGSASQLLDCLYPLQTQRQSFMPASSDRTVVVCSLSPGSGATFLTITLGKLLADRGAAAELVEHPLHGPEWHALLFSQCSVDWPAAVREGYLARQEQHVVWHALLSGDEAGRRLPVMTQESGPSRVRLVDLSSFWNEPAVSDWLVEAELILFVADPMLAKWSGKRMASCRQLMVERERRGKKTYWIANKEVEFHARRQWRNLIPGKVIAAVPGLAPAEWLSCIWDGKWATDRKHWRLKLQQCLEPVLRHLI